MQNGFILRDGQFLSRNPTFVYFAWWNRDSFPNEITSKNNDFQDALIGQPRITSTKYSSHTAPTGAAQAGIIKKLKKMYSSYTFLQTHMLQNFIREKKEEERKNKSCLWSRIMIQIQLYLQNHAKLRV